MHHHTATLKSMILLSPNVCVASRTGAYGIMRPRFVPYVPINYIYELYKSLCYLPNKDQSIKISFVE